MYCKPCRAAIVRGSDIGKSNNGLYVLEYKKNKPDELRSKRLEVDSRAIFKDKQTCIDYYNMQVQAELERFQLIVETIKSDFVE